MMFPPNNPLGLIHLGIVGLHQPGDPPPVGYLDWHEWAAVQAKAGLRQRRCGKCQRWKFPQEMSDIPLTVEGMTRMRGGEPISVTLPQCLVCAPPVPEHDLGGEG